MAVGGAPFNNSNNVLDRIDDKEQLNNLCETVQHDSSVGNVVPEYASGTAALVTWVTQGPVL